MLLLHLFLPSSLQQRMVGACYQAVYVRRKGAAGARAVAREEEGAHTTGRLERID